MPCRARRSLCVAFFLVPEMKDLGAFVWAAVALAVLAVALVTAVAWGGQALAFVQRITFLAAVSSAIRDLRHEPSRLVYALLMSLAYWGLVGTTAWIIAEAIELPVSPVAATLVIIGTTFFATAVPAAPGALGTFEFAIVYVLGILGIDDADSFAYAIIVHAVFFLPATIIAAIFLPREGVVSFRRTRRQPAEREGDEEDGGLTSVARITTGTPRIDSPSCAASACTRTRPGPALLQRVL